MCDRVCENCKIMEKQLEAFAELISELAQELVNEKSDCDEKLRYLYDSSMTAIYGAYK